jgi:hypothetical protein
MLDRALQAAICLENRFEFLLLFSANHQSGTAQAASYRRNKTL